MSHNTLINVGEVTHLLNSVASGTITGSTFATPAKATLLSYQTRFVSNPAAINITIRGSVDNSTWQTLATLTIITGQVGNITTALPFIDAKINSITGGSGISVDVIAKPLSVDGNSLNLTSLVVSGVTSLGTLLVSGLSTLTNLLVNGGVDVIGNLTVSGVTSLDGGNVTTDGAGSLTALELHAGNGANANFTTITAITVEDGIITSITGS